MLQFVEVDSGEFWNMGNPSLSEQTSVLDIMSMKLDGLFNVETLGKQVESKQSTASSSENIMVHGPVVSIPKWNSTSSLLSSTSSVGSSTSPPSPTHRNGKVSKPDCEVCGDKSSGKHYGVQTCEGCKSFFKRSIRRGFEYLCRTNKKCPVDQHHRNQCQHCRLKKCFKVGMKKEAVQRGRVSRSSNNQNQNNNNNSIFFNRGIMDANSFSSALLNQLISAEPFQPVHSLTNFYATTKENMCELATKLLFNAVEWAKNIPFFPSLSSTDQTALIKLGWKELFVLNVGKCDIPFHVTDLLEDNERWSEFNYAFYDHVKTLQYQIEKLKHLQIDAAEYACLKALILFTPDTPGLSNPAYIHTLQEKAMNALESYTKTKYPQQPTRFGKLLLRLSSIRTINTSVIEKLFFTWLVGKTPIETIIQDYMFGAPMY